MIDENKDYFTNTFQANMGMESKDAKGLWWKIFEIVYKAFF